MAKLILSINAGSSSVKISIYSASHGQTPTQLADISIDGLTSPPPKLKYTRGANKIEKGKELPDSVSSQDDAFKHMLDVLISDAHLTELKSKGDIHIVCHRVVHGGDYAEAKIINKDTMHHLEELTNLAPLHNASALQIVRSCHEVLPDATNVAYFDSQFHQSIPEHIRTYPIDQVVARKNKLRKYGFHGISYSFITRSVAEFLGKPVEETSIIALHLGSGASACAVKNGKSWDTSMGLTPLAGLPGATRSGSVDPSLIFHYASNTGNPSPASTSDLHITTAEELLNKKAGWKSLTGTTDFSQFVKQPPAHPSMRLAFDLMVDRICGFVGAYYVSLEGRVDALVFAGGIGEKSGELRQAVTERCRCLGFGIDAGKNGSDDGDAIVWDIGRGDQKHRVLVCATDEQLEMARGAAMTDEFWK